MYFSFLVSTFFSLLFICEYSPKQHNFQAPNFQVTTQQHNKQPFILCTAVILTVVFNVNFVSDSLIFQWLHCELLVRGAGTRKISFPEIHLPLVLTNP